MLEPSVVENAPLMSLLVSPAVAAQRRTVTAGAVLYVPESAAISVFFVQRGQVRTYRNAGSESGRLLEILGPGGWCGEAALSDQAEYGEQATAVVNSTVVEVSASRLLAHLSQHPPLAVELMKQLADKLTVARADAAGLVFEDCSQRLLKTLVKFSKSAAAAPHPDGVVLRITHSQLAKAVGVARETVSLALTQLRLKNLLRTGRNQLTFNPANLGPVISLDESTDE